VSYSPRRTLGRSRTWLGTALALGFVAAAACNPEVVPSIDSIVGGGTIGNNPPGADGGAGASGDAGKTPLVAFTDPKDKAQVSTEDVTFHGTSGGGSGIGSVFVAVGPNVPVLAQTDDGWKTWQVTAKVPFGTFPVQGIAYDVQGLASDPPAVITLTRPTSMTDAASPTVTIVSPPDMSTPQQPLALVTGTAKDDLGVVKMEVSRDGKVLTDNVVQTENFFSTWTRLVPLLPGVPNVLTFTAYDAAGHTGTATITLFGPTVTDTTAPTVAITSPKDGDAAAMATTAVTGSASDPQGVAEVKVRIGQTPMGSSMVTWGAYVPATSTDGFASWKTALPTPNGPFVVQARAIDINGLAGVAQVKLNGTYVSEWSDESIIPLKLHDTDPVPEVHLALDKVGVGQIINESIQKTTKLLDLDPKQLLVNSLGQIKTACGTDWQKDSPNPNHNCALTPLGQTFKGPDGTWQSSAEYSLVRLLTMTPANVVVKGTSIAGLQNIADGAILGIKIGGGFNQVLSDTLGIPRTQEIVSTGSAANALQTQWMASHPALAPTGNIPVTLYDAMNDLMPLGTVLGPAGGHPGIVDPSVPPKSVVFGPDFKMLINATSNLRWRDGVVMSKGKDYIAVVSGSGDVLTFDFNSKAGFDVQGLTPTPTVDLRLKIKEDPSFVSSCNGDDACKNNKPGAPYGSSYVWSLPAWELERIVGYAAYGDYKTRTYYNCLINFAGCQASVSVGQGSDPPGWTKFDILFNLGNPPKNQYLWELISEVAQVALHNFGNTVVPEGQANVAFTLQNVPVGLTADQIRDAVRPYLQMQGPQLSKGLLGDYSKNNGPVDFFYASGADGQPYLMFVAPSDPRPVTTYGYTKPGFFSDQALATKASSAAAGTSGDTVHEKVKLVPGDITLYAQNEAGKLYRLRITVPSGPSPVLTVRVSTHVP
jgi:hypothetical protein